MGYVEQSEEVPRLLARIKELEDKVSDAYDAGFEEGLITGANAEYENGYKDGFRDAEMCKNWRKDENDN